MSWGKFIATAGLFGAYTKKGHFTTTVADIICSSDIINIFIRQKGSGKMQIAICDDEVSMVQILEEKIKKLLPDAVIDKYLPGD